MGVELAGEIRAAWPDKDVTIVDMADDILGNRFSNELRDELRRQLEEVDVDLVLGSALREGVPPTAPGELATFTVTTLSGRAITADIWFRCFGVTPGERLSLRSTRLGAHARGVRRGRSTPPGARPAKCLRARGRVDG